jgi:uncharacterized membrane protein YtjA (UPF0391 family)
MGAQAFRGCGPEQERTESEAAMLGWAFSFFILALIAAILGFGGLAGAFVGIAQICFFLFLVIFIVSLIMGLVRGREPRV